MRGLYSQLAAKPYEAADTAEEIASVSESIRKKAAEIFALRLLPKSEAVQKKLIKRLEYPDYILEKFSVNICTGLEMAVFLLKPKVIKQKAPAVVALCGHGYGVRQILNISKRTNKKILPYIDSYQKNFAVELVKRGCIVAAPELFGFGEARLQRDLMKPFYISSCDELSHHLLPYGLTTASLRIYQALACAQLLLSESEVDPERLGCMGISGGALTALYASVLDERIKRIVLSGYVNTFKDSILSLWHCPDNYIPDILRVGEIYDFASSLAPRELLIESGTKDKLFPIEASRLAHSKISRIYSALGCEDRLIIDVFNGKHSVSGRKSFDFLSR